MSKKDVIDYLKNLANLASLSAKLLAAKDEEWVLKEAPEMFEAIAGDAMTMYSGAADRVLN